MSTHAPVEVSILVVSHNTRAMTLAALDAVVRATERARYELIVVDNASHDGSPAAIAGHASGPRLLALAHNIGFARATNLAAMQASGEYLLLLNPDTVVLEGAIDRLLDFARRTPQAGVWGGRTRFAGGALNPSSCWGRMTLWNLFCRASGLTALFPRTDLCNGEAYGGWARDSEREVDIVSGCFLLVSRQLWRALGGFETAFFMYGDDADLCLRARRAGARPRVTPEATIIHHGGASEPTRSGKMVKLLAAKALLIERHFGSRSRPLALLLLALWPASRALALSLAARVAQRADLAASAAVWREVWSRRDAWLAGYAADGHSAAPEAARC
jgi:GT2 family glycosyltransferase